MGGEQSGHIVLSDYGTTGDGLAAALQVLAVIQRAGARASDVLRVFDTVPQVLRNVRFGAGAPLEASAVKAAMAEAKRRLDESGGRLLVRKSGTEPLIRVMAEGDDHDLVNEVVAGICAAVEAASERVQQAAE